MVDAEHVGRLLAAAGAIVVCGGRGGVMAAASKGAAGAGGTVIGMLPGDDRDDANEWVTVAIPTGIGELRNGLIVRTADAMVAVGGAYGTLSEVALGLQAGLKVYGLHTWEIDGIEPVATRRRRRSKGRCGRRAVDRGRGAVVRVRGFVRDLGARQPS